MVWLHSKFGQSVFWGSWWLKVFGRRLAALLALGRLRCLEPLAQPALQLGQLPLKAGFVFDHGLGEQQTLRRRHHSVLASSFQRRSRATSKLSLSISTSAQAISR